MNCLRRKYTFYFKEILRLIFAFLHVQAHSLTVIRLLILESSLLTTTGIEGWIQVIDVVAAVSRGVP